MQKVEGDTKSIRRQIPFKRGEDISSGKVYFVHQSMPWRNSRIQSQVMLLAKTSTNRMQGKSVQMRNGRECPVSEATMYPWQWDSVCSKSRAYKFRWIPDRQQPYRMRLECHYPVDRTPGPRLLVGFVSKIAKGTMHEQPRWIARGSGDGGGRAEAIS